MKPKPIQRLGVLGAGAWGTALAQSATLAGCETLLWARRKEQAVGIAARRENAAHLPGIMLDRALKTTSELDDLAYSDAILAVVPAQHMRAVLRQLAPRVQTGIPIVLCSKGIERSTQHFMRQVLADTIPHATIAVLSGPNFAHEVAKGLPAAATLACEHDVWTGHLLDALSHDAFRLYHTDDLTGVELGGVVKNVLAIGCGIVEGRRLGKNAHAALVTRGFAEMTRLGVALGARVETLTGLAGLGDLVLTCASSKSRNMSLGYALGQGRALEHVLAERDSVTEGVLTAPSVVAIAEKAGVDMPICQAVEGVVSGRLNVDKAIAALMSRPQRSEGYSRAPAKG